MHALIQIIIYVSKRVPTHNKAQKNMNNVENSWDVLSLSLYIYIYMYKYTHTYILFHWIPIIYVCKRKYVTNMSLKYGEN